MPAPIGLAATFDPTLARRFGAVIANEALAKRNDVLHAPTTNIMRTPLAGWTFEAFGKDPFLASRITVDWIKGAQAEGVIGRSDTEISRCHQQKTRRRKGFAASSGVWIDMG